MFCQPPVAPVLLWFAGQGEEPTERRTEATRDHLSPTGREVGGQRSSGDGTGSKQQGQPGRVYSRVFGAVPGSDRMQDRNQQIREDDAYRFYVGGAINYWDAFGGSHFTNFFFSYLDVTDQSAQIEYCEQHNDSN
jgi:hypothetical protein